MTSRLTGRIEVAANVAIICVAVLLSIILVKNYLLPKSPEQIGAPQPQPTITAGTKLSVPAVDWAANKRTLLLVLSEGCRFCTESADFYKRLAAETEKHGDVRIIALLPQGIGAGRAYLDKLGVAVDDVRQVQLSAVGVRGTPTLILVDGIGTVTESWVGKLPPEKEITVLSRLQPERVGE